MSDEGPLPLRALQSWMQGTLISPQETSEEEVARVVAPSPRLTPLERLGIYQRSYYQRILKCMEEQFPALRHALGTLLFRDFAREYLEVRPSESYTLYELGRRFPRWLEETRPPPTAAPREETWIDFMVDLAHFEREIFEMFDAPGDEARALAGSGTPDALLTLQRCFRLGAYGFPVSRYYHEVRRGNEPSFPRRAASHVALVRRAYVTRTVPLTDLQHAFLAELVGGGSVDAALSAVAERADIPEEDVRASWRRPDGMRARWIEAGFFAVME